MGIYVFTSHACVVLQISGIYDQILNWECALLNRRPIIILQIAHITADYMTWMPGNQCFHVVISVPSVQVKQKLHAETDHYIAVLK